jgi:general stress protein CsbA
MRVLGDRALTGYAFNLWIMAVTTASLALGTVIVNAHRPD